MTSFVNPRNVSPPSATACGGDLSVRRLGPDDHPAGAAVAREAFRGNRFYHRALGLDEGAFAAYWEEFMGLALKDPGARVFGAEWRGTLCGVLVAARHEFPRAGAAAAFLVALARRIGPRGLARYLRFVAAYERAMRRPRAEHHVEARGLWLMAAPRAAVRVGPSLMRAAISAMHDEGCTLYTGFVDADNEALLSFYRRLGCLPGRCFRFAGGWAVVVERREDPPTGARGAGRVRPEAMSPRPGQPGGIPDAQGRPRAGRNGALPC